MRILPRIAQAIRLRRRGAGDNDDVRVRSRGGMEDVGGSQGLAAIRFRGDGRERATVEDGFNFDDGGLEDIVMDGFSDCQCL